MATGYVPTTLPLWSETMKVIKLGVHGIEINLGFSGGDNIISDLNDSAFDGMESLILAHACAGIDVESPAYLEGIEVAVEAIGNSL